MFTPHPPSSASTLLRVMALAACLASASCATLAHGRMQYVSVTSEPAGALVYVGPTLLGSTPAKLALPRRSLHPVLRIEKEGYEAVEIQLRRGHSPWLAGDIGHSAVQFGNPNFDAKSRLAAGATAAAVALGVDFATGAAYRLTPAAVFVTLRARELSGCRPERL